MKPIIKTITNNDVVSNGIFKYLKQAVPEVPEYLKDDTSLDIDYYYRFSGNKLSSPLIDNVMAGDTLTPEESVKLANIIIMACKTNWDKLYNAMTIDYSPIENVDGYITETTTHTGTTNSKGSAVDTGSTTDKKTGEDTTENTGTDTLKQTGTDATTNTGTDTNAASGSDSTTDTGSQSTSEHDNENTGGNKQSRYEQSLSDAETVKEGTTDTNKNENGTSDMVHKITGYNEETLGTADENITTVNQTITDTLDRNVTDTTNHTGNSTTSDNHQENIESWKDITDKHDNTATTKYGKTDTRTLDTKESTTYGKTDTRSLDTAEKTSYNTINSESINLNHSTSGTEDTSGEEKHDLHRHGNIGVTTNQQMINEEIELRKNLFIEMMYRDVDRFLTLPIY